MNKNKNVVWHNTEINLDMREKQNHHKGIVIWFTGLSGSGKSTVATELQKALFERGCNVYILDGDNVRHGLNSDLGFSEEDREENIRRIGEVAKLFMESGTITLCSFISPFRKDRDKIRNNLPIGRFIETYIDAPLDICEKRDPKGLYKKARNGEIKDFTGINSPYEKPENPELIIQTFKYSLEENVIQIIEYLEKNGYI